MIDKQDRLILFYLKNIHGVIPTKKQLAEIQNKEELVVCITEEILIEWEFTVKLSSTCYDCCKDGAENWVMNNKAELFIIDCVDKVVWNPTWRVYGY